MTPLGRKLPVLWLLYFVQGLPYGFQVTALPVLLREAGVSEIGVGFASVLSLPWMLKVVWSPALDRWREGPWGRRKSWILPLQGLLVLGTLAGSLVAPADPGADLLPILILVLFLNLFAATLDVAVDGLAVDLLEPHELGTGNVAQVVGFKFGMLTGGGVLVWASERIGWTGYFVAMSALVLGSLLICSVWREPRGPATVREAPTFRRLFELLGRTLRSPGTPVFLGFIATYKLGETMADSMFAIFLVDAGFTRGQIGLWLGTWGLGFSIAGSVGGGWLATRLPRLTAVGLAATLRVVPVAGEWWLSLVGPEPWSAVTVACAESFFGGALTTTMFAYMMSRVDRRIGAVHYTLLASVEVWGKLPASWLGGIVTELWSYSATFGTATVLSVAYLAWLPFLRSGRAGSGPATGTAPGGVQGSGTGSAGVPVTVSSRGSSAPSPRGRSDNHEKETR